MNNEENYYKSALLNAACAYDNNIKKIRHPNNEIMAYCDYIATDMALKFNIKKNKLISIIGIFMSAYYAAVYFLIIGKLNQFPNHSSVKIIIDRPPGGMGSNIDVFNNIYEFCFGKIHKKTIEHYKCSIEIGIIKDNQEDLAGLKLADMMAHMSAASMVMKNSHNINKKINRSLQLPQYTEVHEKFILLRQLLMERECIVEITPSEMMMLNSLEKSGFVLPNQYLKK